jgi:SAM-dependent methyltransferase
MSKGEMSYRKSFIKNEKVKSYEDEYTSGKYSYYEWEIEKAVMGRLLKRYLRGKAANYLDFACGTGRVTQFMVPFAEKTVGVDISQAMVELARPKCPGVNFVVADVTANPERLAQLGPFDLITLFRFLAPAEEDLRIAVLRILANCLTPNGILIINNNANLASLLYPTLMIRSLFGRPFKSSINYLQALPYRHLGNLLHEAGLDVVETLGVCFIPSIIASRLPRFFWYPVESALRGAKLSPAVAVNQIVVARKRPAKDGE